MSAERLRRLLLGIFVLGLLGTATELLLLGHYDAWQQWLPLAVLALGFVAAVRLARWPDRRSVLGVRGVAGVFILSGLLGVYLHLASNFEFERELDASVRGIDLWWASLTGALPALGPGAMILLGLIALVITAGHPALSSEGNSA
ncbi:MAG: hypothetical protein PVF05_09490 [Gemmatimonadales bacterium]|jgi:hypothetical protein